MSLFDKAVAYVSSDVAKRRGKVSDQNKLRLYSHFKQATVGDCNTDKPGMFDFAGKAKWSQWDGLRGLSRDAAEEGYIHVVDELYPGWRDCIVLASDMGGGGGGGGGGEGGMAPAVSRPLPPEGGGAEVDDGPGSSEALSAAARAGDVEQVRELLATGVNVNAIDEAGATALHYATDEGHIGVMNTLIKAGADVDAKDSEGQTPLHYAAMCERVEAWRRLQEAGADDNVKDHDGCTALAAAGSRFRQEVEEDQ